MPPQRKSAIFVDFDNIYIGLRQLDPLVAEEFATNPSRWLQWIERMEHGADFETSAPAARRILMRHCYLNPRAFGRYRTDFSRAGFRVIECPSMTRQGKSSTDIQLVIDVLDTLGHATHFDEFILLSADADFTPLLQRLRVHDRQTVVVSVGPASPAYRNAADILVPEDEFVSVALGGLRAPLSALAGPSDPDAESTLDDMARALVEALREEGNLSPAHLPRIYVRFDAFRDSTDWLGHWSLRSLTEALVARLPESLRIDEAGQQWVVALVPPGEASRRLEFPSTDHDNLRAAMLQAVVDFVRSSPMPVPMATAAHHVIAVFGKRVNASEWAGAGSFKALLARSPQTGLQVVQLSPTRWIVLDPERHEIPESTEIVGSDTLAARLARRISRTTGVPALSTEQYRVLFAALHELLREAPFDLTETSKALRDRLVEWGSPVSRTSLSFVLRGLCFAGFDLRAPDTFADPQALARAFRTQIATLCDEAELALSPEEEEIVDAWLCPPPDAPDPA